VSATFKRKSSTGFAPTVSTTPERTTDLVRAQSLNIGEPIAKSAMAKNARVVTLDLGCPRLQMRGEPSRRRAGARFSVTVPDIQAVQRLSLQVIKASCKGKQTDESFNVLPVSLHMP
jgi:hypothetical protein